MLASSMKDFSFNSEEEEEAVEEVRLARVGTFPLFSYNTQLNAANTGDI
jgi:hypothetical protein